MDVSRVRRVGDLIVPDAKVRPFWIARVVTESTDGREEIKEYETGRLGEFTPGGARAFGIRRDGRCFERVWIAPLEAGDVRAVR